MIKHFMFLLVFCLACKKNGVLDATIVPKPELSITSEIGSFAKGADVSWITEQKSQSIKFYNRAGVQQDIFQVLKSEGINTIRLRVRVTQ